ncbi:MAG TPA: hypothetical protein VIJ16_09870 [Gemmatimonadaceae bacterium]
MLSRRDFIVLCGGLAPLPFLDPGALFRHIRPDVGEANALPAWFDRARVQGLTGMGGVWVQRPVFKRTARAARALGATVLTRYVKWNSSAEFWAPTGLLTPAGKIVVRDMIDEAHDNGVRIILYYWHEGDDAFAASRPQVYCRQPDGAISTHPVRGKFVDMTDPVYSSLVKARINEMAGLGADGFYFDYMHLPPTGCLGTQLERDFESQTGKRIATNRADDDDPIYHEFLAFAAARVTATFEDWKRSVRVDHPDTLFIISTTYLPSLLSNRMNTDLVRVADSPKTEIYVAVRPQLSLGTFEPGKPLAWVGADDRLALGYCYLRDSGNGRPPHVWAPGFLVESDYQGFVAAVLTFGCIAAVNIPEPLLNDPSGGTDVQRGGVPAAFALGGRLSEHLGGTRPLRWLVVHVSEAARNARGVDFQRACREVLAPEIGAFATGLHAGLPVGTIDDYGLASGWLDGAGIVFLPDEAGLAEAQRKAVTAFRARGGTVIAQDPTWSWTEDSARAEHALLTQLGSLLPAAPVRVRAAQGTPYAAAHLSADGSRTVVGVTKAFSGFHLESHQPVSGAVHDAPDLAGVEVSLRTERRLVSAEEVVTGTRLTAQRIGGSYVITLPEARQFAFVSFRTE